VTKRASRIGAATWGPLALLLAVTIVVPAMIFDQFRQADDSQRDLLLRSIRHQGALVVRTMTPLFEQPVDSVLPDLALAVARIDPEIARIRVFVRPLDGATAGFFYVATNARLKSWQMEAERREITALGVLSELEGTCQAGSPRTTAYQSEEGAPELITSIVPYRSETACWVLLLSHNAAEYGAAAVRDTWDSPKVHAAMALYITLVVAAAALIASVLLGLARMRRAARSMREGDAVARFGDSAQMPQFAELAREFDDLVAAMRRTAEELRGAAEDNAHALKTPVATIRHAAENLQAQAGNPETRETLGIVLRATDRLSELVQSIRRLDQAAADALAPQRHPVDLSALLTALAGDYRATIHDQGITLGDSVSPGLTVSGDVDMLETVFENLLDNAVSFAPRDSRLQLNATLDEGWIEITLDDQGPGVAPELLERIFERHVSIRPDAADSVAAGNFGIGLWICRRHIAVHGGTITAANRPDGGLRMCVRLPARPST
jgi:two-component system, OmpR family, sensor histidine kinase ChvG